MLHNFPIQFCNSINYNRMIWKFWMKYQWNMKIILFRRNQECSWETSQPVCFISFILRLHWKFQVNFLCFIVPTSYTVKAIPGITNSRYIIAKLYSTKVQALRWHKLQSARRRSSSHSMWFSFFFVRFSFFRDSIGRSRVNTKSSAKIYKHKQTLENWRWLIYRAAFFCGWEICVSSWSLRCLFQTL